MSFFTGAVGEGAAEGVMAEPAAVNSRFRRTAGCSGDKGGCRK